MPIEYRYAMAYVVEGARNMDVRCWRGTLSLEVYGELEWLCTIHLNNWYDENGFNVAIVYLRDRGGVTGDDELILDSHSSRASARAGRVSVTTVSVL